MIIIGQMCPYCKTIIYSRTRHDCILCKCQRLYVDGGFDYLRMGFREGKKHKASNIQQIIFEVDVTLKELFDDYSNYTNNYGYIETEG